MRLHLIMISLAPGARIVGSHRSKMERVGQGILYITSNGIVFERQGRGPVLDCGFDMLASFEAVKKDRLLVVVRTPEGRRSARFEVESAGQVEQEIAQANLEYAADVAPSLPDAGGKKERFDQDAHSRSEARWFEANWGDIMKFLRPERASYLGEYVGNAKVGSPNVDPYVLVVDYENLTYRDFADLPGFLRWRYGSMTDREVEMISGVFRDFDDFSVSMLEMDVQMCKPLEHNFTKKGYTVYQFVAIVAREKLESGKLRESQQAYSSNSN